jgi:NADH dehydrogenase FAD-containing subunit
MRRLRLNQSKVVVVGGGYGGVAVAKALDSSSEVVLIEPKDAFMHNIAALRALVDPSWLSRIFFPYTEVMANGRVVHDRASLVDPHRVVTSSGEEFDADYIVLATGSRYPFPAKTDLVHAEAAREEMRATNRALSQADWVLLVGAGPVGIELAGEIREVWPTSRSCSSTWSTTSSVGPMCPSLEKSFVASWSSSVSRSSWAALCSGNRRPYPGSWVRSPWPPRTARR